MSLHPKTKPTNIVEPSQGNVKQKRGFIKRWLFRVGIVVMAVVVIIPAVIYFSAPKYYTVLFIGSDQRSTEHARSDVLLLLAIPKNGSDKITLLSIPRDTKIDDEVRGIEKITHYYAMWDDSTERLGNRQLTQQAVEQLLGIKIDGTLEVTFASFEEIVNNLGGVDTSQGHIDGAAALELVHNRFNKPDGDFGRQSIEREVVKSIMEQVKNPTVAHKLYSYFTTSDRARLTISKSSVVQFALAYLLGHGGKIDATIPQETSLPGVGEKIYTPAFGKDLYYWVTDPAKITELVDTYLR